jgi:hypothetical protein
VTKRRTPTAIRCQCRAEVQPQPHLRPLDGSSNVFQRWWAPPEWHNLINSVGYLLLEMILIYSYVDIAILDEFLAAAYDVNVFFLVIVALIASMGPSASNEFSRLLRSTNSRYCNIINAKSRFVIEIICYLPSVC